MAEADEHRDPGPGEQQAERSPLWLPPRRPDQEPAEQRVGPTGWLPPRAPGSAPPPPAGDWAPSPEASTTPSGSGPPAWATRHVPGGWDATRDHARPQILDGKVLAGWWSRVGATMIDGVVMAILALLLVAAFFGAAGIDFFTGEAATTSDYAVSTLAWLAVTGLVGLVYAPAIMARTNGQTLGKLACGIRVIRTNGDPVDWSFAAWREVGVKTLGLGLAGSATFGFAYAVDYLWPLWDDQNRALHDMVVQSRVVRAR
jgi:uncharacterized RDD family membrane protein YckC